MSQQRFIAREGDSERTIKVEGLSNGHYRVTVDDVEHEVDARRFETGNWSVITDGVSYDVELEPLQDGEYNARVRDSVFNLSVRDERRVRIAQTSRRFSESKANHLVAPMPGKVVRILVKPGDKFAEDQPLVIMEAMKMENELRAPGAGTVKKALVEENQAVESSTPLLELDLNGPS